MEHLEEFLAQAIRQRKLEAKLTKHSLKRLREALGWVRGQIEFYGLSQIGPNRTQALEALRREVESYMAQRFSTPLMELMQTSDIVQSFVEKELQLARKIAETAGGAPTGVLSAASATPLAVSKVMVNGVSWGEMLTERLPKSVADKVNRMLGLFPDDVGKVFADAVIRPTERQVEALITSGVQDTGGLAQQLLWQVETDAAWQEDTVQIWSAMIDSRVCATCMGLDGTEFPMDYEKQSPHPNCRCVLLPKSFFEEGRSVVGDDGIEMIDATAKGTEKWLRENPETAKGIFGKKISQKFLKGELSLDKAVRQAGGI